MLEAVSLLAYRRGGARGIAAGDALSTLAATLGALLRLAGALEVPLDRLVILDAGPPDQHASRTRR